MQVDFYHLMRSPLDRVLPVIARRVLAEEARLLIVDADPAARDRIDRLLWTFAADSFLPHAQAAGGDADKVQPVLIAEGVEPANGARNVALADGEWRDAALAFDRAFLFFDEGRVVAARSAWKDLAGREDVERRYWKQDESGRWEQAA